MNKNYSKKRPRGRPKKRRGKDKAPKLKETGERDDEEEETKAENNVITIIKPLEKIIKEEVKDEEEKIQEQEEEEEEEEEEEGEEEESDPAPTPVADSAASTSSAAPEALVAQLTQLQESVVSHILQYQAGVMAQFQQLQQQMLSELSTSTPSNQPQVTVTPIVKTEPNERKRRASAMNSLSENLEEASKSVDMQFKRKRTAFTEKQYEVLETTFVHNNFPEPIDQHCIALRIKTPYRSIKMWFQNRRASIRKRMTQKEKDINSEDSKSVKNNSDPDTRWYCSLCPSTFISKKFLDAHVELHEKETLNCPNCNMAFTHKVLLDTHKISKCTSKTGVDLSHLEEESREISQNQDKIKYIKSLTTEPTSTNDAETTNTATLPSPLPLLLLKKMQKQQQQLQQCKQENDLSSPPPLIDPNTLTPLPTPLSTPLSSPQSENSVFVQQQRLMQQLLLAQLQQAAQLKAKDQPDKADEEEISKEIENSNGSLTLGGLTIFPVKSSKTDEVKIKEEIKQTPLEEVQENQPSTLQDQITSILQSQGLKSAWKSAGIKDEDECDSKSETKESMKEQIQAILRHQEEQRKKAFKISLSGPGAQNWDDADLDNLKRHRRRTTVFNEVQLRTLYMHFTHCNFPDPAMFKIIGHLIKLDAQVIKIWFQNERSRQRKRATHIVDEVSSKDKPYKCRDCGMSFAMLTFLVKHSMRHNGETDQDANVRTCPLCLQKWNKEVFSSHLKSRHNVNLSLVEERNAGSLKCYLCSEKFPDQENLMIHKHQHLKDEYGDPPQCSQCKTTFVNAICLEAHLETHETAEWTQKCNLCGALFHDKMLLTSHKMGHGVPLAPVSTIDRSRSQLQHSSIRAINALARKTVASAIESLNKSSSEDNNELLSDNESMKSEKGALTVKTSISSLSSVSDQPAAKDVSPKSTSSVTPSVPTIITSPTVSPAPVSNLQLTPPTGPVSYVKLIPVQLIPTNNVSQSGSGQGASGPVITAPTTAFISVPVSIIGSNETACNPILNNLLDSSSGLTVLEDKGSKKKALPNLIPITSTIPSTPVVTKQEKLEPDEKLCIPDEDVKACVPDSTTATTENEIHDGSQSKDEEEATNISTEVVSNCGEENMSSQESKTAGEDHDNEEKSTSEESPANQGSGRKRYVPILPLIPIPGTEKVPIISVQPSEKDSKITSTSQVPETPMPQRPKSSRNVPNKRLWESFRLDGYKRRRTPTYFSGSQREILEAHFDHDNFPDPGEQMVIADQLGVEYAVVKTWFQNTRKNFRKQMKEEKSSGIGGPFHCQKCNVAYISEASLNEHVEVHALVTGIKCQECDLNFAHQNVLKTHHTVCHKNANLGDSFRRKKYGVDILDRFSSSQTQYDGDNEEASGSDSQDESNDISIGNELMSMGSLPKSDRAAEESLEDGEDYHPIMAVECILDNSDEDEVQKSSDSLEQRGHKCTFCGESFASLIALKEHSSRHCIKQELKPGHFRRRRKLMGKRKHKFGNNIRCFDCYSIFSDRNSYLEHFGSFPCNSGRQRIEYTDEEQKVLLTHYDGNNFPLPSEMSLLARRLGVRYRQIMHWFQNRRSKERKKLREGGRLPPVECQRCKASFVTDENLNRHRKIVHGEVSSPITEHACPAPGCGAFFPNEDLLLTHSLAHQIDSDSMQTEEERNCHKLPNLGPTSLWKDFAVLEAHYSDNNFPDPMDIGFIARRLQVDPLHVHMWFKERRNQHIRKLEENGRKVMEGETAVSIQKALSKVCSVCDAAFICQTDLESHEDMHKSSRAKVCSLCGLEFSNVVVLETHWIRHGIEVSKEKRHSPERATKASFSAAQMEVLDTHYEHNNFPVALEIWLIAVRLKLRPRQVTHWFQNRRGRDRRLQKISTPYSRICGRCGASFICDLFLNNHLKLHKTGSRFPCSECSAVFLSSVLQKTHVLYHNSIPKDKALCRKNPDGARDPMTEGQVKDDEEEGDEHSDTSEGELKIDESEGYAICIENNEDDNSDAEEEVAEDIPDLPDTDYEPSIEENSLGESVALDDNSSSVAVIQKDVLDSAEAGLKKTEEENANSTDISASATKDKTVNSESQSVVKKMVVDSAPAKPVYIKKAIREEVFFDDNTDSSDDDEDEPRLRIVSAYTISGNPEDLELEENM